MPDISTLAAGPRQLVAGTPIGTILSRDGHTWRWACHAGVGYEPPYQPPYAVSRQGTVLAASHEGLAISRDGGCDFRMAGGPLEKMYVDHVVVDPRGRVWAVTSTNSVENGLYVSRDDGRTFEKTTLLSRTVWFKSILVRGREVLVSAYDAIGKGTNRLYRSTDDGATFQEVPAELPAGARLIFLLVGGQGARPGGPVLATGIVDERPVLLRADATLRSWRVVLSARELSGATLARDAAYAVVDGALWRAKDAEHFAPTPAPVHPRCVVAEDDALWLCADLRADKAIAARRRGQRWEVLGKGGLRTLAGPVCEERGSVARACAPLWQGLKKQLGL